MFGAQQSLQHGVSRHADLLQTGSLELAPQIHDLYVEVSDLQEDVGGRGEQLRAEQCDAHQQDQSGDGGSPRL